MRCAFSWATRPAAASASRRRRRHPWRGGDIACAVAAPDAVRLLIGDVMGHDSRAARTAVAVTRAFRRLAAGPDPLPVVAARLHDFVADHVGGEVFVTAQFIAIPAVEGRCPQIVCCGHPPPLLLRAGQVTALDALPPSPPLGLLDLGGGAPRADLLARPPRRLRAALHRRGQRGQRLPRPPLPAGRAGRRAQRPGSRDRWAGAASPRSRRGLPELLAGDLLRYVGGCLRDDATLLCLRFADTQAECPPLWPRTCCALLITFMPGFMLRPRWPANSPEPQSRKDSRHWGRRLPVMPMPTALEIARQATLKPITEIAEDVGIPPWLVEQHGEHVAKIDLRAIEALPGPPEGQVRRRHGHHAHSARRGQDDHDDRPRHGVPAHRQEGHDRDPPGVHGPHVRHQGRRRRRRLLRRSRSRFSTSTSPATCTRCRRAQSARRHAGQARLYRATPLALDSLRRSPRAGGRLNDRALRQVG